MPESLTEIDQQIADLQARVGQRIRIAREGQGIPRRVLSETSGVSQRYLAQLETGEGNISIALLLRVAGALGLTLEQVVSDQVADAPDVAGLFNRASPEMQQQVLDLLKTVSGPAERAGRIALIGLRGAGKTTLGSLAAKKLGMEFVELNIVIEEQSGMPVGEVMELYGQEGYRRLEAQALQHVIDTRDQLILAVSGGIVAEPETYAQCLSHFHTVWLRATPDEHMARVRNQGDTRPMAGNPEAMDQLKRILSDREGDYSKASTQMNTSGVSVIEAADNLAALIYANGLVGLD